MEKESKPTLNCRLVSHKPSGVLQRVKIVKELLQKNKVKDFHSALAYLLGLDTRSSASIKMFR